MRRRARARQQGGGGLQTHAHRSIAKEKRPSIRRAFFPPAWSRTVTSAARHGHGRSRYPSRVEPQPAERSDKEEMGRAGLLPPAAQAGVDAGCGSPSRAHSAERKPARTGAGAGACLGEADKVRVTDVDAGGEVLPRPARSGLSARCRLGAAGMPPTPGVESLPGARVRARPHAHPSALVTAPAREALAVVRPPYPHRHRVPDPAGSSPNRHRPGPGPLARGRPNMNRTWRVKSGGGARAPAS